MNNSNDTPNAVKKISAVKPLFIEVDAPGFSHSDPSKDSGRVFGRKKDPYAVNESKEKQTAPTITFN
jgi:hypothetical protein